MYPIILNSKIKIKHTDKSYIVSYILIIVKKSQAVLFI